MKPKERKARFNALSEIGCILCQRPAEIHHLIGLKYRGIDRLLSHQPTQHGQKSIR